MNSSVYNAARISKRTRRMLLIMFIIISGNLSLLAQQAKENFRPELSSILSKDSKPGDLVFKQGLGLKAANLFTEKKTALGLRPDDAMVNCRAEADKSGFTYYHFQQYYKSIPVEFVKVAVIEKNNEAVRLFGTLAEGINISSVPVVSEATALRSALQRVNASKYAWEDADAEAFLKQEKNDPQASNSPTGRLVIINDRIDQKGCFHLAWKFNIAATIPAKNVDVYIDAMNGGTLYEFNCIKDADTPATALTRYSGVRNIITTPFWFDQRKYILSETTRGNGIHTRNMYTGTDFSMVGDFYNDGTNWRNNNLNYDDVATDVHWGAEISYDYFNGCWGRNSFDNNGAIVNCYVHYGNNESNAYAIGNKIYFGDGDGTYFTPWASLDIVGHEFTHLVTQHTAMLVNTGEPGSLDESFSDMFGTMIEFYGNSGSGNYTFGENICQRTPFLRSLSSPGDESDPNTYNGINWRNPGDISIANDYGGRHHNSGISNFWFYLLCKGKTGINDLGNKYKVKPLGMDVAGKIAFYTLVGLLGPTADFAAARQASISYADMEYGHCSNEKIQVTNAWYAVGVGDPWMMIDQADIKNSDCNQNNGSIELHVLGFEGTPVYAWSNGGTTAKIENLASAVYSVTITDPNTQCTIEGMYYVRDNNNIDYSLQSHDVTSCGAHDGWAGIAVSGLSVAPEIRWSNGERSANIQNLQKGSYYITITDPSTHCTKTDFVEIGEPGPDLAIIGGGQRVYCAGNPPPPIILRANFANCNGCNLLWSTGETSLIIHPGSGGAYSVMASDAAGCSTTVFTTVRLISVNCNNAGNPQWQIPVYQPVDPNEITGPAGYGPQQFVAKHKDLPYTVFFENDPDLATAPALKVYVETSFDHTVDMYSLRLGDFGFGKRNFSVPANSSSYSARLDLRDSLGIYVDVTAGLDMTNHKGFWIMESIDPLTGVEPNSTDKGFLPVNDSVTNKGEGFVSFTQQAEGSTITGDTIHASANIKFDVNSPLSTNTWTNIIDALAPVSQVHSNLTQTDSLSFKLTFTGNDDPGGSGIDTYSLFFAANNGPFTKYSEYNQGDTAIFKGAYGSNYQFFSIATDHVGNREVMKTQAEVQVNIHENKPKISGIITYDNSVNTPMNNVLVNLRKVAGPVVDTSTTTSEGLFALEPTGTGNYAVQCSTVKPWGGVNAADALLIMKHFANLDTLRGIRAKAADVNASGYINSTDALLVAKRFTQLVSSFAAGDWAFQQDTISFNNSNFNHDVKAICIGDVNGSFVPNPLKNQPVTSLFNQGSLNVNAGGEFVLPISVMDKYSFGAISLVLFYPSDLIEITGVETPNNQGEIVYNLKKGMLRLAWYSLEPLKTTETRTLLWVKAKAKSLTSTMFVLFKLGEETSLADPHGQVLEHVNLYIPSLRVDVPLDFSLSANHPNPFREITEIGFALPEKGMVSLTVSNTLGEQVDVLVNEIKEKGTYQVTFNAGKLEEGVYYGKIAIHSETRDYIKAIKMILIRN